MLCCVYDVPLKACHQVSRWTFWYNRVIHKVKNPETQHQNLEFGHTQGEIKKKNSKNTLALGGRGWGGGETQKIINFDGKLSFMMSLLLLHIFSLLYNYSTLNTLEPCALNDEFQRFVLSFIKIFLLGGYRW